MKKTLLVSSILLLFVVQIFSQNETNVVELQRLAKEYKAQWNANRQEVIKYSLENNVPIRIDSDSAAMEMQYIDQFGMPQYYITENANASATLSTNKVNSGGGEGLSLDGSGMTVHEWDGGGVLLTHQEFGSRVTQVDGPISTHYHSTHVAGTMIASGVESAAKGMAPQADLDAYDWNSDNSEMASAAAGGALVSNHSYGLTRGWRYDSTNDDWYWYGSTSVSTTEDYLFGFYDSNAEDWDEIAYNAPYFLICKSAGNDRGDYFSGTHYVWSGSGWVTSTAARDADGGATGYDCVGSQGVAKNILTVGAVNDIPGGYMQPSDVTMSSFSGWGPADDGRIKPDVVGNGVGVYSSMDGADDEYASLNGTSMASPNVAGSLILLQEHYEDLKGSGSKMRSATLKALVIHTADEAGSNPGPDYIFGWGLVNIKNAAQKITEDNTNDAVISEHTLSDGGEYTTTITATSGFPIKVTVVWTDPKGTPTSAQLDPATAMLVNDLDLRVADQAARTVHYPWKLDRTSPAGAATNTGQNDRDNVEVVYIENPTPGETYTITVDHDGSLSGGSQAFSMIISGYAEAPDANFSANTTSCQINETVYMTDVSTGNPTSWLWSVSPNTYSFVNSTSATSQNPEIEFTDIGFYTITLYAENATGNDTEVKTDYIFATNANTNYCDAYSTNPYGTINRVQFGSIDNMSTYTDVGTDEYYEDFTSKVTDLYRLESESLTVSSNYSDAGLDLGVWIDWNRDGDFDDTDEDVVCEEDGGGIGTFNITVPVTASFGHARMRLRIKYHNAGCGSSCGATSNGEVEDYTINIQPPPAIPPVAEFTADNTNPSVGVTVSFTDQSTNVPTSWLWSFDPATINYTGGTSSSSQNPQVQFTTAGSYEVSLYAENAYGNDTETKSNYISVSPFTYCAADGGGDEYISGVQLNTINNTGTGADGYHDYTSMSTDLELAGNYDITVTNGNAYTNDDLGVWADWNQDGDFDDSGENIVCEVDDDGQGTYSISVPATASLGSTTIRARIKYTGSDCGDACGTTTYGEVEDYTISITTGTLTWDGSESSDWNDPDNWNGGVVPTSSFDVIIPNAASVPNSPSINTGITAICMNLTLESGATLNCDGDLILTGTP